MLKTGITTSVSPTSIGIINSAKNNSGCVLYVRHPGTGPAATVHIIDSVTGTILARQHVSTQQIESPAPLVFASNPSNALQYEVMTEAGKTLDTPGLTLGVFADKDADALLSTLISVPPDCQSVQLPVPVVAPSFTPIRNWGNQPAWDDSHNKFATLSGTYTGNGSAQTLNLTAEPALIIVTGGTAIGPRFWAPGCWMGRSWRGENDANTGDIDVTGRTVTLAGGLMVNATVYSYVVVFDPYEVAIWTANFQGNYTASTYKQTAGLDPLAMLFKRDNTVSGHVATKSGAWQTDGTATSPITINADGSFTVTSSNNVNGGESNQVVVFRRSEFINVFEWTSRGSNSVPLPVNFEEIECLMFFPESASYGYCAHVWMSGDPGATNLHQFLAGTVNTTSLSSVDRGRISFNGSTNPFNKGGEKYLCIAINKVRNTPAIPYILTRSALCNAPMIDLGPSSYIDCGTDDSLRFDGAFTLEWLGQSLVTTAQISGGNADTAARALLTRALAASATPGTSSFGLYAHYNPDTSGLPTLWVANQNFLDFPTSGQSRTSPRQVGVRVEPRKLQHYVMTYDGAGGWNIWVNGQLKKWWVYASEPLVGTSGHRTLIGAVDGPSSKLLANGNVAFSLARLYNRALTAEEVQVNLWAAGHQTSASPTSGFVEEWKAQNITGTTLPATVNPANNGTITGTFYQAFFTP